MNLILSLKMSYNFSPVGLGATYDRAQNWQCDWARVADTHWSHFPRVYNWWWDPLLLRWNLRAYIRGTWFIFNGPDYFYVAPGLTSRHVLHGSHPQGMELWTKWPRVVFRPAGTLNKPRVRWLGNSARIRPGTSKRHFVYELWESELRSLLILEKNFVFFICDLQKKSRSSEELLKKTSSSSARSRSDSSFLKSKDCSFIKSCRSPTRNTYRTYLFRWFLYWGDGSGASFLLILSSFFENLLYFMIAMKVFGF